MVEVFWAGFFVWTDSTDGDSDGDSLVDGITCGAVSGDGVSASNDTVSVAALGDDASRAEDPASGVVLAGEFN